MTEQTLSEYLSSDRTVRRQKLISDGNSISFSSGSWNTNTSDTSSIIMLPEDQWIDVVYNDLPSNETLCFDYDGQAIGTLTGYEIASEPGTVTVRIT